MPLTRSLQEVVLAVHFSEAVPLTVVDVAAWIAEYGGDDNPTFQEMPPLGPTQLPSSRQQSLLLDLRLASTLPRVRIMEAGKHNLCVIQSDRIAFGWQRDIAVGEQADYPGYESLRGNWVSDINRFSSWLAEQLDLPISPRLVELSYNNAYQLETDGRVRRISDIIQLVSPGNRLFNTFNVTWSEPLGTLSEGYVQTSLGLGTAPPGQHVIGVNYFGLASVDRLSHSEKMVTAVMEGADKLHTRILDIHNAAIVKGA